jgi:hypothetical protein
MQSLRRWYRGLVARVVAWRTARQVMGTPVDVAMFLVTPPLLTREVSRTGVRVVSLCAVCGGRLEASATLCDDCASRRTRALETRAGRREAPRDQ